MSSLITYYCAIKGISTTGSSASTTAETSKQQQKPQQKKEAKPKENTKQKQGGNAKQTQAQPVAGGNHEPVPPALLYYCAIKQIPIHPTTSTTKERQANFVQQKVAGTEALPKAGDLAKERHENFKNQKVEDLEKLPKAEDFAKERQENFRNQKVENFENQQTQGLYPPSDPIHLPNTDPQNITYSAPAEGALYPPSDPIHLPGDQYAPTPTGDDNFIRNSDYPPTNPNDLDEEDRGVVFQTPDTNTLYPPTEVGTQPLQPLHDPGFYPPGPGGYAFPPSDPGYLRNTDYPPTNPHDLPSTEVLHSQTVNISAGGEALYPPSDPSQINHPYISTLEGVTSPAGYNQSPIYPPDQGSQYGFNAIPAVNLRTSGSQQPNTAGYFSGPPPTEAAGGIKRRNTFSVPQEYQQLYPTPARDVIPEIESHLNNFPIQLNQSGSVPTGGLEFPGEFSSNTQSPASLLFPNNQENRRTSHLASQLFSDIFTRADKNDDGNITFDEFTDYFEEQVLNTEELKDLFNAADLNHNQTISLSELEQFFNSSFQTYSGLFESLARMHSAISITLNGLYKHYPYESRTNQFTTRVLMNEFLLQIKSLFETVHASLESLQVTSTGSAPSAHHNEPEPAPERNLGQTNAHDDLRNEVNRLSSIVNKLVNAQARLQPVEKDTGRIHTENSYLAVSRIHEVSEDSGAASAIGDLFSGYVSSLSGADGLLSVYVRQDTEQEYMLIIHEIWESKNHLETHNRSKLFKQFQKDIIDFLDSPVVVNSAEIPQAWWISN